jgi:hypothetical protein
MRGQNAITKSAAQHPAIMPAPILHAMGRATLLYCIRLRQRVRLS